MGRRLLEFFRANAVGLRVLGLFLLFIVLFSFLLTYDPILKRVDVGEGMAQLAAWMSFYILKMLGWIIGYDIHRSGRIMGSGEFEVDVSPACSGAVPASIYLAAVLAYPASGRAKLIGSLLGVVAIHLVNLVRVSALFLVGLYFRAFFHDTHVYVAQALVICVAVAVWLYWAARVAHIRPQPRG